MCSSFARRGFAVGVLTVCSPWVCLSWIWVWLTVVEIVGCCLFVFFFFFFFFFLVFCFVFGFECGMLMVDCGFLWVAGGDGVRCVV